MKVQRLFPRGFVCLGMRLCLSPSLSRGIHEYSFPDVLVRKQFLSYKVVHAYSFPDVLIRKQFLRY